MVQAEAAGISGTPSFVLASTSSDEIEGAKIVGAMPYAEFDSKIKQLLAAASAP
jgi:predicted DsbA family dithiol-disulfide isomerase